MLATHSTTIGPFKAGSSFLMDIAVAVYAKLLALPYNYKGGFNSTAHFPPHHKSEGKKPGSDESDGNDAGLWKEAMALTKANLGRALVLEGKAEEAAVLLGDEDTRQEV